ncbi:hypothetical protein ACFQ1S_32890, partial [Kibdelosporangium lantanae]
MKPNRAAAPLLWLSTLTMGLMAGLFYAFAVMVMPALAKTGDHEFIAAMQSINRGVQNGGFAFGFYGAFLFTGAAARGGWAVEVAVRRSWEHAAACVVVPAAAVSAGSGEVLAERLGVTLIIADDDPLKVAVRVASAVAGPEAARTQLVARCAGRLSEVRPSARHVLGVLNAELPSTSVAFVDGTGTHLAGRQG